MGLSATEISNSTAGQFDVELRFFGGLAYNTLDLWEYVAGENNTDTSGWTEVTSLVTGSGGLTYARSGNSLRWTAQISGVGYTATLFGSGQAIMCLRRILVAGVQTVPASGTWELWWLGQVVSGGMQDDYQHGGAWSRSIGGLDTALQRATAPRLTAGRYNLLRNATVDSSSTLLNPAVEAGSGEFAGTLVSVAAANTIDGNLNTLWISNDAPSANDSAAPAGWINKAFFKPLTGYDQTKLWWIEFWCPTNESLSGAWTLTNKAGQTFEIQESEIIWQYHQRLIVCASRADYEAYTGGGVSTVLEVKSSATPDFTLDPDEDWVKLTRVGSGIRAALAWNQTGADPGISGWTGGACDVSDDVCPPGSGLQLAGGEEGGAAEDYFVTNLLIPGDDYTEANPEWLLYTLEERTNALDGALDGGEDTITLNSTLGLLDAGDAICEADTFSYTGRTNTTLTGVTGIGAHASGANVYQVIGGLTQYGWPCSMLELKRPHNAALAAFLKLRVYFVSSGLTTPATPDDEDWELDYDGSVLAQKRANVETYDRVFVLQNPEGGPRWVRYLLVVFDEMSDAGRAKLNEARLWLAQTQIDNSGMGDIDSIQAYSLARYIFSLAGSTTYLSQGTSLDFGPWIGEHATAVAPYPAVLDDLARITGCVMDWDLAGVPVWWPDQWWPIYLAETQWPVRAALDATYLRGEVQYAGRQPNETGVRIHARTPDGLQQYIAEFPANLTAAAQIIEYDDLVAVSANAAGELAQALYYKAGLHYSVGPQEATFTLKGPGEWLRPEQWLTLACYNLSGQTVVAEGLGDEYQTVSWLTESITWTWGRAEAFRTWAATATCRRYWR